MEISEHNGALRAAGGLLADAAERAGLDAKIPSCPGWLVRDLLRHTGGIHRWAARTVSRGASENLDDAEIDAIMVSWPADDALVGWFRQGHAELVTTLSQVDPAIDSWYFLPAPSALAFWARRQAHETTIHQVDAELAAGRLTPIAADLAADGVDELLTGFASRRGGRLRADSLRLLGVVAADTGDEWLVRIGPEGARASREPATGECVVRGPAANLYRYLWNRCGPEGCEITGDRTLLDRWRDSVTVRWG